jgi:hypothetical protein
MTLAKKIDELNRILKGNTTIVHYTRWDVGSYGKGLPLGPGSHVENESVEAAVDMALSIATEWEERQKTQAEVMTA